MVYDNSKDVNVFNFIYSIGGVYGNKWLQVGVFNTEPVVDTASNKDGDKLLSDTPRIRGDFTELTQRRISRLLNQTRPLTQCQYLE